MLTTTISKLQLIKRYITAEHAEGAEVGVLCIQNRYCARHNGRDELDLQEATPHRNPVHPV